MTTTCKGELAKAQKAQEPETFAAALKVAIDALNSIYRFGPDNERDIADEALIAIHAAMKEKP